MSENIIFAEDIFLGMLLHKQVNYLLLV